MLRTAILAFTAVGLTLPAAAGSSMLAGTWSGEGVVQTITGGPEPVSCKVLYWQTSETVHAVAASCTSASFAFEQSGELTTVREGRYVGEFENAQYQIHGKLRVLIDGDDPTGQAVTFTSDQASGEFALKKQL